MQFIVKSVHEVLVKEFGLEDGLASTATWGDICAKAKQEGRELALPAGVSEKTPFVHILDPATGTATFLVEVIDVVYATLKAKWRAAGAKQDEIYRRWNEYVPVHLLPRLYGFELMMAPYAIAHMKIGLKLAETGYQFPQNSPRVNVFLTNALEPAHAVQPELAELAPMLAHEAEAARQAKSSLAFTVLIGNPPYSGESMNKIAWIEQSIRDEYQRIDGVKLVEKGKKNWLLDDYVKFLRLCHIRLCQHQVGVAGLVLNNAFIDNPTFRGLRNSLLKDFEKIRLLNLHGSGTRNDAKEGSTAGRDENVFDIVQGVCLLFLSNGISGMHAGNTTVGELIGPRQFKFGQLSESKMTALIADLINPREPKYYFAKLDDANLAEYEFYWPLPSVFPTNGNGVITAKDRFAYSFDPPERARKLNIFLSDSFSDEHVSTELGVRDNSIWSVSQGRARLKREFDVKYFVQVAYRPFDLRESIYHRDVIFNLRRPVTKHIFGAKNIALLATRMTKGEIWKHVFCTSTVSDCAFLSDSTSTNAFVFPVWQYVVGEKKNLFENDLLSPLANRQVNITSAFISALLTATGLNMSDWRPEDTCAPANAEKVFRYIYAVLHSPTYRSRYSEFLKREFPRIPIPGTLNAFDALAETGAALVALHTLSSRALIAIEADPVRVVTDASNAALRIAPVFFGSSRQVLKVGESKQSLADPKMGTDGIVRGIVYVNGDSGFVGVNKSVWELQIGGYQVLHKWLDARRKANRRLSDEDIAHWRRIYAALEQTIVTMGAIDVIIDEAGGFPDAFANIPPPAELPVLSAEGDNSQPEPKPRGKRKSKVDVTFSSLFEGLEPIPTPASKPLQVTAAAKRQVKANEISANDAMAAFRECLAHGQLTRDELIRDAAHALGVERAGKLIKEVLDGHLRAAVRRGIVANERGMIRLAGRTIEDFERGDLKDQFIAALAVEGHGWVERTDAIRGFARWLGFTRTGTMIDEIARSLINGLLREQRIEADNTRIRRTKG